MKKSDIGLTVVCLFVFIYTSVWVHTYLISREQLRRGQELVAKIPACYDPYAKLIPRKEKDLLTEEERRRFEEAQYTYYQCVVKAISAFDNCLHSYTPFNPYLPEAAKALFSLAGDCLNKNEFHLALSAYRTIRISPDPSWVAKAEQMIQQTYAKMEALANRRGK